MTKILFSGDRTYFDVSYVQRAIREAILEYRIDPTNMSWVVGDAKGLDAIVRQTAEEWRIPCAVFAADWVANPRGAGNIRNAEMLKTSPNLLLAFPLPGSKGTWDMVAQTAQANKGKLYPCFIEICYRGAPRLD